MDIDRLFLNSVSNYSIQAPNNLTLLVFKTIRYALLQFFLI